MQPFVEQFVDVFTNERASVEPFVAALPFVVGRALFTSALLVKLNEHVHVNDLRLRLHLWAPSVLVTAGDACLGALELGLVAALAASLVLVAAVAARRRRRRTIEGGRRIEAT